MSTAVEVHIVVGERRARGTVHGHVVHVCVCSPSARHAPSSPSPPPPSPPPPSRPRRASPPPPPPPPLPSSHPSPSARRAPSSPSPLLARCALSETSCRSSNRAQRGCIVNEAESRSSTEDDQFIERCAQSYEMKFSFPAHAHDHHIAPALHHIMKFRAACLRPSMISLKALSDGVLPAQNRLAFSKCTSRQRCAQWHAL